MEQNWDLLYDLWLEIHFYQNELYPIMNFSFSSQNRWINVVRVRMKGKTFSLFANSYHVWTFLAQTLLWKEIKLIEIQMWNVRWGIYTNQKWMMKLIDTEWISWGIRHFKWSTLEETSISFQLIYAWVDWDVRFKRWNVSGFTIFNLI